MVVQKLHLTEQLCIQSCFPWRIWPAVSRGVRWRSTAHLPRDHTRALNCLDTDSSGHRDVWNTNTLAEDSEINTASSTLGFGGLKLMPANS